MLCKYCAGFSLKLLREGDYTHQPSLEHLQSSALNGCGGCDIIYREIDGTITGNGDRKTGHVWFQQANRTHATPALVKHMAIVSMGYMDSVRTLYLAADEGSHASRFVNYRVVDPDPTSATTYRRLKGWIHDCVTSHPKCRHKALRLLPTRVLDVSPPGSEFNKLRLYTSCGAEEGDYVALSYCWGNANPVTTTRANLESHKRGILEASLPQTIRDAISVTRELGIRFLWVDALCIIQDSLNGEDWHAEASKMRDVYSNAYVTISAEIAIDANAGFLAQRSSEGTNRGFMLPYISANGSECGSVYLQQHTRDRKRCLSYRAWAFQERRLSIRVLDYRGGLISLTCRTGMSEETSSKSEEGFGVYEAGSRPVLLSVLVSGGKEKYLEVFFEWYMGVENYSRRNLTNASDKLPALSGFAHAVRDIIGGTYLAGIWKEDLLIGLLWSAYSTRNRLRKSKPRGCPSWSWAALDGPVVYQLYWMQFGYPRQESGLQLKLIEDHIEPLTVDSMGQVISGNLTVSGHIKKVMCLPVGWGVAWERRDIFTHSDLENWDPLGDFVGDFASADYTGRPFAICLFDTNDIRPKDIWCLAVVSTRGLVLEYLAEKDVYQRVGFFMFSDHTWMSQCPVSTITIV
ncbi:HET domain containing protein [Hyaloscypha variabilis]